MINHLEKEVQQILITFVWHYFMVVSILLFILLLILPTEDNLDLSESNASVVRFQS